MNYLMLGWQIFYIIDEIVSYFLLGKKLWWGWFIKAFGLVPLTAINIICGLYAFHLLNLVLLGVYITNLLVWMREEDKK